MENRNLPIIKENNLPQKIKKQLVKYSKIVGTSLALATSLIASGASAVFFPVLTPAFIGTTIYSYKKFRDNTGYAFKDLAFVGKNKKGTIKIEQDLLRPDIYRLLKGLDNREKLGFLQLQALVGMTKFDINDKQGKPITLETDSHGIIRNTLQKLSELGYLQNYEEKHLKDRKLVLAKLAFSNNNFSQLVPMYNMKFQKTGKQIDFDDPEFRKMFPLVFSKRGILARQGYMIERNEEGIPTIKYGEKRKNGVHNENIQNENKFREEIEVDISPEEQNKMVERFIKEQKSRQIQIEQNREKDI